MTYKAVLIFKTVIAFCFLGILCSLFAFILDLVGPKTRALKLLRRNAIMSIVTGKSNHIISSKVDHLLYAALYSSSQVNGTMSTSLLGLQRWYMYLVMDCFL